MEQLKTLSAFNLSSKKKIKSLVKKLNRIIEQQDEFERLRLEGDLATSTIDEQRNAYRVKVMLQQLDLDLSEEYNTIQTEIAELNTEGTDINTAYLAILAVEDPDAVIEG